MNNSKRIWIILIAIIIVPIIWNKGASFIAGQKMARMMAMPTKVETDTVQEAMINEQNEYVGRIEARKDVKIVSRVSGWLQKKFYNDGDFVKKGQVLFQIEPDEYILAVKNAEAELRRVQANYDNSLIELNRAKELVKGDYVSRSYYDEAFAKYSSDKALVDAAKSSLSKAKLNLGYTKIKAPFDGKIGKLFITEGNYVTAQTGELATLVTVDPIYAKFTVKAEDLLKYRKSSDGNHFPDVKVELQLADNTIYNEGGQLDFVDNKIEEDLGTIMLRATFPNKNKVLIPNDFVKVILTSKQPVKVAIIPQKAVLESVNSKFVWIIDENGRAKQQDIKVGNAYGDYWILTEGLNIGDTIISSNIQKIHQGSKVEKVEKAQTESTEHKKK